VIVSVLLSFINNAIGQDEAALKKRLIKQVAFPKLYRITVDNGHRFGSGPSSALEFACASELPSSQYGIRLLETSGDLPRTFGKVYFASSLRSLSRYVPTAPYVVNAYRVQVMGLAMLRISTLQNKWKIKISQIMEERQAKGFAGKSRKYAMFILPFITVLREGLEAVVFVGGVSLSEPATSFPLAVVAGILCGTAVGYFIYR
jgi:hypothetical protein